jgi:hypothetical protein
MKKLGQVNRCAGRGLFQGPPEYEAGMLPAQRRRIVVTTCRLVISLQVREVSLGGKAAWS